MLSVTIDRKKIQKAVLELRAKSITRKDRALLIRSKALEHFSKSLRGRSYGLGVKKGFVVPRYPAGLVEKGTTDYILTLGILDSFINTAETLASAIDEVRYTLPESGWTTYLSDASHYCEEAARSIEKALAEAAVEMVSEETEEGEEEEWRAERRRKRSFF